MPRAQRVWVHRSVLLLACAWPVSLQYATMFAAPEWSARVTAVAIGLGVLIYAVANIGPLTAVLAVGIFALLGAAVLYIPQVLLFVPPVIVNAALAAFFGASLRPGREPIISVFARLEQGGNLPPDLASHARSVTWTWTLLLAAIAMLAAALAIWAPLETWSLFVTVVAYALIAMLFIGEYAYRRVRFRHYRHASLVALLRNVRRAALIARR